MDKPEITLEQARTLDALARHGSVAKAARELHKVHSALLYSLKSLEEALGLVLLDRTGYRARLTPAGFRVLELCQRLLHLEQELGLLSRALRAGAEPLLTVVFDGLLPVGPMLQAVRAVQRKVPGTRVALYSEFLGEVETRAESVHADVMVSVLPASENTHGQFPLEPLPAVLVAHREHPLAKLRRKLRAEDFSTETFLTVRGSDPRLAMSTQRLQPGETFLLSDFHAKKAALLGAMGYGWMPAYLVDRELKRRTLRVLRWGEASGRHLFHPVLYHRQKGFEGPAAKVLREALCAAI